MRERTLTEESVIYEDNHLLVVSKAAGLLTQPVPGDNRPSLEEAAKEYLKEKYNKPGRVFLHAVHRIDRQVSGLVIFARTDKALSRLNKTMRESGVTKTYRALVEGLLPTKEDTVRLRHFLHHGNHRATISSTPKKDFRESILTYRVLQQTGANSYIEIDLKTGRYHQIRAQMAHIGHPITGDLKYGAQRRMASGQEIALHSFSVSFPHPVKKELLELTAPCPPHWPLR